MEKEKLESLLIDYIDGKLSDREKSEIEQLMNHDADVQKLHQQLTEVLEAIRSSAEWRPGDSMKARFEDALNQEIRKKGINKTFFFQPAFYRVAAGIALLISGVGIGFWIHKNQQREEEFQALRKELNDTKQMMMSMLDNRQSASQRMMGATVAFKMERADDQIVMALAKTLNEDPNTNVRLAALEALGKFHQEKHVRNLLIESLATQKDPMVQIALIRLMVDMKAKDAVNALKRITNDVEALPAVKDEAHVGILRLS
jgi:HEAT repeats